MIYKTTDMKRLLLILTCCLLLICCDHHYGKDKAFFLEGVWTLRQVKSPEGYITDYPMENSTTCHIYDSDSTLYECTLSATATGMVVVPRGKFEITLIDRGDGYLYLEDDDPRPLTILSDTSIIIQRYGMQYTWVRAKDIAENWGDDILGINKSELMDEPNDELRRYVLSTKERHQANVIHGFAVFSAFIILVALFIAQMAFVNRRERRRLQLQLQQIHEVQENRPASVRQVIATVENEFFASDDYHTLQQRISSGQQLKEQEWTEIEELLKNVYPGFCSQLRSLYTMSELEYQVCLLIKLHISPTEIASVLLRDVSTISTVRSRLFYKVFGRKGGAKDWDDFILSIGT